MNRPLELAERCELLVFDTWPLREEAREDGRDSDVPSSRFDPNDERPRLPAGRVRSTGVAVPSDVPRRDDDPLSGRMLLSPPPNRPELLAERAEPRVVPDDPDDDRVDGTKLPPRGVVGTDDERDEPNVPPLELDEVRGAALGELGGV